MRQVVAIARLGSFGKAAQELGVSQPTLSKNIARLEDELRFKLFDRSGWRAQLTPMGEFIVERANRVIVEAKRFERDIDLFGLGELGEVKIGLGPVLRARFMPLWTTEIVRRHPGLKLTILSDGRTGLLSALERGDFDLLLIAKEKDLEERKLVTFDVMTDAAVAVAGPDHPLAGRARIPLEEFLRHPTAASAKSSSEPPSIFAMPHLSEGDFHAAVVTNVNRTAIALAEQGLCTFVGSEHLVRTQLDEGALVRLDLDWSYVYRTVVAMTPAASQSPLLRRIVEYARTIGSRLSAHSNDEPVQESRFLD